MTVLAVGAFATWTPSGRAARVDPAVLLRIDWARPRAV